MSKTKFIFEFIGSFIFFSVISKYASKPDGPFIIGLCLSVVIFFGMTFGAGHYNPMVSTIMYLSDKMSITDYIVFISLQLLAGILVWLILKQKVLESF